MVDSTRRASAVKEGDFDGLRGLTSLTLLNNALTTLPADIFNELTALTVMSLRSNALTTLPAGVFDNLTKLTQLDMARNGLTTLPDNVFETLTALRAGALLLVSNPGVATFLPVANAGADATARTGATANLSGSATGPWGNNVTWGWIQVTDEAGTTELTSGAVTLTDADTATPGFTAPSTTEDLYFKATVTGRGTATGFGERVARGSDTVKISVARGK